MNYASVYSFKDNGVLHIKSVTDTFLSKFLTPNVMFWLRELRLVYNDAKKLSHFNLIIYILEIRNAFC